MLNRLLDHIRHSIVGYIALFIAMGGSGYAAISLPSGSVGSAQLRNGSIGPVKFNRQFINGSIRAWAVVSPTGTVQASAGKPTVTVRGGQGIYNITWRVPTSPRLRCFAMGGLTGAPGQAAVIANLGFDHQRPRPKKVWGVNVNTFGVQGQALAASFYAALVC